MHPHLPALGGLSAPASHVHTAHMGTAPLQAKSKLNMAPLPRGAAEGLLCQPGNRRAERKRLEKLFQYTSLNPPACRRVGGCSSDTSLAQLSIGECSSSKGFWFGLAPFPPSPPPPSLPPHVFM